MSLSNPDKIRLWRLRLLISCALIGVAAALAVALIPSTPDGSVRPAASLGEKLLLGVFAVGAVGAWVSAIGHAWNAFASNNGRRYLLLVLLVVGNFVGGLIYFLTFAAWSPGRKLA